jgi:DNA-binding response OmpR family regulator
VRTDWGGVLADINEAGASGLSILVVESDPAARCVLVDHLRRHGFRIVESEHGGPAIRTAVEQPFDYVVVDIDWLGVSDGAALARWTRTSRPETNVILTSTTVSHWFSAGSTMAGLPIIKKPFSQEELDRVLAPVAVPAVPGA